MASWSSSSTRESLLSIIDDIELVARELVENLTLPKARRLSASDHEDLTLLLLQKDTALQEALKVAAKQESREIRIREVKAENSRMDVAIQQLQRQLKDAETLLATSIYQAKQKLCAIEKAKELPVPAEELIKYGHRISASNAVSAPLNWQQGDPRRPYPTDVEMRVGNLAQSRSDGDRAPAAPASGTTLTAGGFRPTGATSALSYPGQQQANPGVGGDMSQHTMPSPFQQHQSMSSPSKMASGGHPNAPGAGGLLSWQGGEMALTMKDGSHIPIPGGESQNKDDQVEMMSTDSSSSSSTDSN